MANETEVIEGQAAEMGTDLAHAPAASPPSLWRTEDPVEILKRAKATADALAPVIRQAGLVTNISGKDYLTVEAWQTLGQQVGVTAVVTETRRLTNPDGWEARAEARTLDGRVIGAADSMCLRAEERWKDSADFEIRSMAQTRAMSRALASVLRFIPTLAGFAGTPAEEMDRVAAQQDSAAGGGGGEKVGFASEAQEKFFRDMVAKGHPTDDEADLIARYADATQTGFKGGSIGQAIDNLKKADKDTAERIVAAMLTKAREWNGDADVTGDGEAPDPSASDEHADAVEGAKAEQEAFPADDAIKF